MRRALFALLVSLSVLGCAHAPRSPTAVLEEAARAQTPDARQSALAGFHALLLEGNAEKAKVLFEASLAKNPSEAWAHYGQLTLAHRAAHPERALEAALTLLERAPQHPLAPSAAQAVYSALGLSLSTDEKLLARSQQALVRAPGEVAALLRAAASGALLSRGDREAHARMLQDLGAPTVYSVAGPFSAFHTLDFDTRLSPESSGEVGELPAGPVGKLAWREVPFADGYFTLGPESRSGDVYLLAVDFTAAQPGEYELRTISQMDHAATLDGATLFTRRTWALPASTVTTAAVRLEAGAHRLMLKVAREQTPGGLAVSLSRLDGTAAQLTFAPARGPAPRWSGVQRFSPGRAAQASARDTFEALKGEAGDALAAYVAASEAETRDPQGARALSDAHLSSLTAPALRVLRAELALADRAGSGRSARGGATRDYEGALEKDPGWAWAALAMAQLALDDGRHSDAIDLAARARAAHQPPGPGVFMVAARAELAMGNDARADLSAAEAEKVVPGHCGGLSLRYDVARRRDAVLASDALLASMASCPDGLKRKGEHLRARGDVEGALAAYRTLLERDDGQTQLADTVASLLASLKRFSEAQALLERMTALWPRNPQGWKQLGDLLEQAGKKAEALSAREQALLVGGGDLALRRSVHRAKTGKELLEEYAISTEEALKAYDAAPGSEDATSAFILDAAAVRVFPDGSMVDRIHIIQKALDQSGVSEVAEVNIPRGAQVLKLRTIKPDGTVLEPESIEGKDAVSMPGVQVGDLVEYEFLEGHSPRPRSMPGFTAPAFYFQVARQPNNWSTYTVIAPKGFGMVVDPHHVKAPPVQVEGDFEVLRHDERRVPPYIPEPNAPPSPTEWLPHVIVGAGARGNDGLIAAYADAYLDRGQVTPEVARWAASASGGKKGLEQVRAIFEAANDRVQGRDQGLAVSAHATVLEGRGSRLWLLYAAYRSLGYDARVAVVRPSTVDPNPFLFPNESLLPYLAVRVALPEGQQLWLDPIVRFAPFSELPELAQDKDAWLFPEPGKPLEKVRTPRGGPRLHKEVKLTLSLGEDGVLSGSGEETYLGFEAAQLAEALDALDPEQRQQALQGVLSRFFGGADLSSIELDAKRAVGAPLKLRYAFKAPRFARREGEGAMVLGQVTYPAWLGRRYLALSERTTALFVDATEGSSTKVTLTLPPGWTLQDPLTQQSTTCPWGQLTRKERQQGNVVTVEEDFQLRSGRIPAPEYLRFAQFAGEVDLLQGRDLLIRKK